MDNLPADIEQQLRETSLNEQAFTRLRTLFLTLKREHSIQQAVYETCQRMIQADTYEQLLTAYSDYVAPDSVYLLMKDSKHHRLNVEVAVRRTDALPNTPFNVLMASLQPLLSSQPPLQNVAAPPIFEGSTMVLLPVSAASEAIFKDDIVIIFLWKAAYTFPPNARQFYEMIGSRLRVQLDNMELMLRMQNQRNLYALLFHHLPMGVMLLNAKGHILECNRTTWQMFGYEEPDMYRLPLETLIAPQSKQAFQRLELANPRYKFEYQYTIGMLGGNGEFLQTHWRIQPLAGLHHEALWLLTIQDMTTYYELQEGLQHSEARYRTIVENQVEAVCRFTPGLIITFVNQAYCKYAGKSARELIGTSIMDFIPEHDREAARQRYQRLAHSGGSEVNIFDRVINGRHTWYEWNDRAIVDEMGELLEIQAVGKDITDRKLAEDALRMSEERYRMTLATMAEGVLLTDDQDRILMANPAAIRMLRLTHDDLFWKVGDSVEIMHEDGSPYPSHEIPSALTLRTGESVEGVVMGLRYDDGEICIISINTQPLVHDGETKPYGTVSSFADITEQRLAQHREIALRLERERIRFLTNFIDEASHQFRTPLSVIHTHAYLIQQFVTDERVTKYLNRIEEQSTNILNLVETLVQMARLDGHIPLQKRRVALPSLIHETRVRMDSELKKAEITLHLEPGETPPVYLDSVFIQQALVRLLQNAIQYSSPGSEITIRTGQLDPDHVWIEVIDSGTGIDPADIPHLFERFFRGRSALITGGFGLGLSIVHKVMEAHGGRVEVESELEKGSRFRLILPLHIETVDVSSGEPLAQ